MPKPTLNVNSVQEIEKPTSIGYALIDFIFNTEDKHNRKLLGSVVVLQTSCKSCYKNYIAYDDYVAEMLLILLCNYL